MIALALTLWEWATLCAVSIATLLLALALWLVKRGGVIESVDEARLHHGAEWLAGHIEQSEDVRSVARKLKREADGMGAENLRIAGDMIVTYKDRLSVFLEEMEDKAGMDALLDYLMASADSADSTIQSLGMRLLEMQASNSSKKNDTSSAVTPAVSEPENAADAAVAEQPEGTIEESASVDEAESDPRQLVREDNAQDAPAPPDDWFFEKVCEDVQEILESATAQGESPLDNLQSRIDNMNAQIQDDQLESDIVERIRKLKQALERQLELMQILIAGLPKPEESAGAALADESETTEDLLEEAQTDSAEKTQLENPDEADMESPEEIEANSVENTEEDRSQELEADNTEEDNAGSIENIEADAIDEAEADDSEQDQADSVEELKVDVSEKDQELK
ncbi:hypothetical protein JXA32_14905 [Candidatus Sumerlaeota bacterium]|nr:hypothetical protein [Candidatus Sumerlaeota bacterium]